MSDIFSPPISQVMDSLASQRSEWIQKNTAYYGDLKKFLQYHIPKDSNVLEIGCGTGELLDAVQPKYGVGIDVSAAMIKEAKRQFGDKKNLTFLNRSAERLNLTRKFEYVILSDTIGYFSDVQQIFEQIHNVCTPATRIIITYQNFFWNPIFNLAEQLELKMPSGKKLNWLNLPDIENILHLAQFETIKKGKRFLFPFSVPLITPFINHYLSQLPIINEFCITTFIIARPFPEPRKTDPSLSVIIPARNEKGNIESAIKRMPRLSEDMEVIFVEGHSTDGTLAEIQRVCKKYSKKWNLKWAVQTGKGKGDAVRVGFDLAKKDLLMILDADLTVPPEDLQKFYQALASGKGELVNGSRLVYPMEDEAMQTLNRFGNTFFSWMFTWILGQRFKDTLCGTKTLSRKNWLKIVKNRGYFGEFDPFGDFDLIFGASKLDLKIIEIPIRYRAREYGSTNISRFKHGLLLLQMVVYAMRKIKFT